MEAIPQKDELEYEYTTQNLQTIT